MIHLNPLFAGIKRFMTVQFLLDYNFPKHLDETVYNIQLQKLKIKKSGQIPSDYGKYKKLIKIQKNLQTDQDNLKEIPLDFVKAVVKGLKENNVPNLLRIIKDLETKITEIENIKNSKKYEYAINKISKILAKLEKPIENFEKSSFDVQKLLTTDFSASLSLSKENIYIHQKELDSFKKNRTDQERLEFLNKIKKEIKLDQLSLNFLGEEKLLKILQKEKNTCDNEKKTKRKLLERKIKEIDSLGIHVKLNSSVNSVLYKKLNCCISNLEKLELLKKEAVLKPSEVMTLQVCASEGRKLDVYLPKNQKLSNVLQKIFQELPKKVNLKTIPIIAKAYSEEVNKEFFDYLATEIPPRLTNENVLPLIHLANRFDVPSLVKLCLAYIKKIGRLDFIPELLQMGYQLQRKELINCCVELIIDHINKPKDGLFESLLRKLNNNNKEEMTFEKLITTLLFKGIESNQKEMIWFAIHYGMKKKETFSNPDNLIKNLEEKFSSINKELCVINFKLLVDELAKMDSSFTFKKELGKIELRKLPQDAPVLLNLSQCIPLTLDVKEKVSKKDYFDFIGKIASQKIQINVNKPEKWKETRKSEVIAKEEEEDDIYAS